MLLYCRVHRHSISMYWPQGEGLDTLGLVIVLHKIGRLCMGEAPLDLGIKGLVPSFHPD